MKKAITAIILCVSMLAGVFCLTGCAGTVNDRSVNELLCVVTENSVGGTIESFDGQEDGKLYAAVIDASAYSAYDLTEFVLWAQKEYSAPNTAVTVLTTPEDTANRSAYIGEALEELGLDGYWYNSDNAVVIGVKISYAPKLGHSMRISVDVRGEYETGAYHPLGWLIDLRRTTTGWECVQNNMRTF